MRRSIRFLLQVIQEVEDLVNDRVQSLPVRRCGEVEQNVDLAKHLIQFFPGELDGLLILGCLLDPGLETHRNPSCTDQRLPLLFGYLERELFVWWLPFLGWHDSYPKFTFLSTPEHIR